MADKTRMAKAQFGQRPRRQKRTSWLEERIAAYITGAGLPVPVRELRFTPPRLFRFDFAWPALGIALEVEGGIWVHGRHSRGAGLADDAEKYNLATMQGWRVFRVTERQVRDGSAFTLVQTFLTTPIRYVSPVLTDERTPTDATV